MSTKNVVAFPAARIKRKGELQEFLKAVQAAHATLPESRRPSKAGDEEFARLLHATFVRRRELELRETPEQTRIRKEREFADIEAAFPSLVQRVLDAIKRP